MSAAVEQIEAFLVDRFGPVADLVALQGGAWSQAYSFRAGDRELVLRVGHNGEDFDKELAATAWRQPGLPVPDVVEVGEAFDCAFIVSQLHHGTKLADLESSRVPGALEGLFDVLAAMRSVVLPGAGFGIWLAPDGDAPAATWAGYLRAVADRDEHRLVDWRRKLSLHVEASAAFRLGCSTLLEYAGELPTTRGLVHADLLLNHLIGPDERIAAVFDWGNALAGDPLYDVAWIVFCIPWFPAIHRQYVLDLARQRFPDDDIDQLLPLYELHIALGSLQYMAFADDLTGLAHVTARVSELCSVLGSR